MTNNPFYFLYKETQSRLQTIINDYHKKMLQTKMLFFNHNFMKIIY